MRNRSEESLPPLSSSPLPRSSSLSPSISLATKSSTTPIQRNRKRSQYFPLGRIRYFLDNFSHAQSISDSAVLTCAIALEIVLKELFDMARDLARIERRNKINHRHILLAIRYSDWLGRFLEADTHQITKEQIAEYIHLPRSQRNRKQFRKKQFG
ncbi:Histone H2A [Sarcoptes scabiei]|uniref:Histone H2A n=1 Tax=Sarcoptes scabiei TaxID=52283 RepID=A0A834RIM1_SARSC|nr:Histone H2A [Sarcoptes scabiei]